MFITYGITSELAANFMIGNPTRPSYLDAVVYGYVAVIRYRGHYELSIALCQSAYQREAGGHMAV